MLTKENILHFLKKGRLEHIPFGMELEALVSRLGPAECTETVGKKDSRLQLLKYDRIEFHFSTGERQLLRGIQVTHLKPCAAFMLKLDHGEIDRSARYEEVKETLEDNEITFRESYSASDLNAPVMITDTGITFYFSEGGLIEKYGRFLQGL